MSIEEIISTPRVHNNIHESTFRAYHILDHVLEMVQRGDSKETILQTATFLKYYGKQEVHTPLTDQEKETLKAEYEKYGSLAYQRKVTGF